MLERFLKYIAEEGLFQRGDRVLLGVSGGMDSMLMAALFSQSGYPFGMAHCNFGLRGSESDQDEQFVKKEAEKLRIPFYSKRFQTHAYAEEKKISTQMAARELRYTWFDQLAEEEDYQVIALAHHLNDLVETMLINLLRGTGPAGMHSMQPRNGNRVRPLLCFTREEIAREVAKQKIPYREESSNASDHYLRNRLRHHLVPMLKAENPSLEHTFAATARHFAEAGRFIDQQLAPYRAWLTKDGENWRLPCEKLTGMGSGSFVLFRLLQPFGFNADVAREVFRACNSQAGKQFFSPTHRLIKDRDQLIITPLHQGEEKKSGPALEDLFETAVLDSAAAEIDPGPNTAYLDYDTLQLPLTVRNWQPGDRFHPLGMRGHKKLSDFFIDLKIPLHRKHRIPLVCSGEEIVWVAGYRIAEPFKVSPTTKKVYRIRLKFQK